MVNTSIFLTQQNVVFLASTKALLMHQTHHTLAEKIRSRSTQTLNRHLAAAIDLHAQLKQAHWNVRGASFIAMHELFDRVSVEVENVSDLLAERIGGLGGVAEGRLKVVVSSSYLTPYLEGLGEETIHVFAVSAALASFSGEVRGSIEDTAKSGDAVTSDLFTQVCRSIDQQLWFVESHQDPR